MTQVPPRQRSGRPLPPVPKRTEPRQRSGRPLPPVPPRINVSQLINVPDEAGVEILKFLPIKDLTRLIMFNKSLTDKYWPYFGKEIRKEFLRRELAKFVNSEVEECKENDDFSYEYLDNYFNNLDKDQLVRVMHRVFRRMGRGEVEFTRFETGENFDSVQSDAYEYANSKCYQDLSLEELYQIIVTKNMVPLFERGFDYIEEFQQFIPA